MWTGISYLVNSTKCWRFSEVAAMSSSKGCHVTSREPKTATQQPPFFDGTCDDTLWLKPTFNSQLSVFFLLLLHNLLFLQIWVFVHPLPQFWRVHLVSLYSLLSVLLEEFFCLGLFKILNIFSLGISSLSIIFSLFLSL